MVLERARLLDIAWSWALGTHRTYQTQFNYIQQFEQQFGLAVLIPPAPSRPPCIPDIPLSWCIKDRSTVLTRHASQGSCLRPIAFNTIRQLQSAAAQFYQLYAIISHPASSMITNEGRLLYQSCRPTDNLPMRMLASGMSRRLGTVSRPSTALFEQHVLALDLDLETRLGQPFSPTMKLCFARAGFANVSLWLCWLRSNKNRLLGS